MPSRKPAIQRTETPEGIQLQTKSATIRSVDDLVKYADIDLTLWQCTRQVVNKWEVGAVVDEKLVTSPLFQVKAWFERIPGAADNAAARSALLAEVKRTAPSFPALPRRPRYGGEPMAAELFAPDPHHGKLAWHGETGTNYDAAISERIYSDAIDNLVGRLAGLNIEEIIFPIGNDFFHTDTPQGTTTGGTPQDVDGRWMKTFRRMRQTLIRKIGQLRQVAPVRVIIVPGNHDETKMFYLGDALEGWLSKCHGVTIDNRPTLRKYHSYGISLIGYAHGDKERPADYPMLMAHEAKAQFSRAQYYEWHLGHLHKREEHRRAIAHQITTDTVNGVVIRRTPSLGGTDAWHYGKGYVHAPRQADLFLWGKESGPVGYHTFHYREPKTAA
jgi:hypothetical protein